MPGLFSIAQYVRVRRPSTVRLLPFVLTAVCLAGLSHPAHAQSNDPRGLLTVGNLDVELKAGFDGLVDQTAPLSVSLLMRNNSGQEISGTLQLTDPGGGSRFVIEEVFLTPGSARRVSTIHDLEGWYECFAELVDDSGVVTWRQAVSLTNEVSAMNAHYCLVISDSTRVLTFPEIRKAESVSNPDITLASTTGRDVESLTVKTWQVPNHSAPMEIASAIIIPEGTPSDDLNRQQWRSIGEWVCLGGKLYVPANAAKVRENIRLGLPFPGEPAIQEGPFRVERTGLGEIIVYEGELFAAEDTPLHREIAHRISLSSNDQFRNLLAKTTRNAREGGQADVNRMYVLGFFAVYTILSGVVVLLLVRQNRKRVITYTCTVVLMASVAAGVLGGILRMSEGDLRWNTVTYAGAGGMTQVGRIDLQSGGARSNKLTVAGSRPDLQFTGPIKDHYWNRDRNSGIKSFTWRPNLLKADDAYQINVPMTPWGRSRTVATAFKSQTQALRFQLKFTPDQKSDGLQPGEAHIEITNQLPFTILNATVVIGTSTAPGESMIDTSQSFYWGQFEPIRPGVDGSREAYHMEYIGDLNSNSTTKQDYRVSWGYPESETGIIIVIQDSRTIAPRITRAGAVRAWIVGHVAQSPILAIDKKQSDFLELEQSHVFVQEILPHNINADAFHREANDNNRTKRF